MTILKRIGRRLDVRGHPVVTWGFRFHHQHRQYKQFFGSRALAVEGEKRLKAQLHLRAFEGQFGPLTPRLTTWADAVARYAAAKADKATLPRDLDRLAWWGTFLAGEHVTYLQELTPEAIDKGKQALTAAGHRPASIYQYLAVLRGLCRMAMRRWRTLTADPTEVIDWPRIERETVRLPTLEEWRRLLDVCDPVLRALVWTLTYTGLRKMSGLRLTAENLTERPGWIRGRDQKGRKAIWLPVIPEFRAVLDGLGVIAGPLFRGPDGHPMTRFPEERWNVARKAAGLTLRVHDLRHLNGTLLSDAGVPPRVIQEWLGHASLHETERYIHPGEAGFQEAARLLGERVAPPRRPRR